MNERLYNKIVKALEPYYFADKHFAAVRPIIGSLLWLHCYLQKIPDSEGMQPHVLGFQIFGPARPEHSHSPLDRNIRQRSHEDCFKGYSYRLNAIDETQNTTGQTNLCLRLRFQFRCTSWIFRHLLLPLRGEVTSPTESSVSYASMHVALPINTTQ